MSVPVPPGYAPTSRVNYAQLGSWYSASDLSSYLTTAEHSAFNVQTVRDGLRDAFNSIPKAPPFAKNTRFPPDEVYISGFKANWNQLIIQMTTALAYKPGVKDNKNKTVDSTDPGVDNDVVQAFYQSIKAMKELLLQPPENKDLFAQDNFENFFRLTWH